MPTHVPLESPTLEPTTQAVLAMANPSQEQPGRAGTTLRGSSYEAGATALAPKSAHPPNEAASAQDGKLDLEKVKRWTLQGYETHLTDQDRAKGATPKSNLGQHAPLPTVPLQTYQRGAFSMTLEMGADGPVLSFAGTDPKSPRDLLTDMNATGVGFGQFADNAEAIQMWLRVAHSASGQRVTVVGHSLGGAHAQWAASFFPQYVGRVITMDAPAISAAAVGRVDAHNQAAPPEGKVKSTHFVTDSGIGFAGERHTPGDLHWYSAGHRANVLPSTHSSELFPTEWNHVNPAMNVADWDAQVLAGGLEGNRDLGAGVGLLGNLLNSPRDMARWRKLEKLSDPKLKGGEATKRAASTIASDRGRAISGGTSSAMRNAGQATSAGWEATKGAADSARRWWRGK